MNNAKFEIIPEIISICKRLYDRNMLAGADGNVSYRVSDQKIFITPSGLPKAFLRPEDMAIIDMEDNIIQGRPSSERKMHLEVYRNCPQAKSVIHAHPPTAVAWSVAQPDLNELPNESLAELILNVGKIPIISFAMPGTDEMAKKLQSYVQENRVMILSRHGALSWGEDLIEAINGMERIEHTALILYKAHSLGGLSELSTDKITELKKMRSKLGPQSS